MAYTKTQVVGGNFQSAIGTPLSNGWLVLVLSHDENVTLPASQVTAGILVKIFLGNLGSAQPNQFVWATDVMSPTGSYYTVEAYNNAGLKVWAAPQYWQLSGPWPIDLGTLVPFNP